MAKVLVIDDSSLMRKYVGRCLQEGGFEVEEWVPTSAMEIPDKVTSATPDLVITDYQMPGCNGGTVARMVQKANPQLPILILTAFRDKDMDQGLQKFGVVGILHKPITANALIEAAKTAVENAQKK